MKRNPEFRGFCANRETLSFQKKQTPNFFLPPAGDLVYEEKCLMASWLQRKNSTQMNPEFFADNSSIQANQLPTSDGSGSEEICTISRRTFIRRTGGATAAVIAAGWVSSTIIAEAEDGSYDISERSFEVDSGGTLTQPSGAGSGYYESDHFDVDLPAVAPFTTGSQLKLKLKVFLDPATIPPHTSYVDVGIRAEVFGTFPVNPPIPPYPSISIVTQKHVFNGTCDAFGNITKREQDDPFASGETNISTPYSYGSPGSEVRVRVVLDSFAMLPSPDASYAQFTAEFYAVVESSTDHFATSTVLGLNSVHTFSCWLSSHYHSFP